MPIARDRNPQSADHTPCRSWRLPDLFFLHGISDDHDRLEPRRSSSARKCSSRRAPHRAPRTEGWSRATLNRPPPPGAPRLLPPLGGRAVKGDRPGQRDRPVSLWPVSGETRLIRLDRTIWKTHNRGVAPQDHRLPRGVRCDRHCAREM